jgi:drug/metabolite transporter (DMT)-like permease
MGASSAVALAALTVASGESFDVPTAGAWASVIALALVVQAFGWIVLAKHVPRVPSSVAALLLLLQPTLATVWGALAFGETLGVWEAAGAVAVLAGIYLGAMRPAPRADARAE